MKAEVGKDVYVSYEEGASSSYNVTPARVLRREPIVVSGREDTVLVVRPHGKRYNLKMLASSIGLE